MDTSVIGASRRRRRSHSDEFKAMVVQACLRPGVSIASVALANALNANMLRKWVIDAEQAQAVAAAPKSIVRNKTLTAETPTSTPNFRSSQSFSVTAGSVALLPRTLRWRRDCITPESTTSH